MQAASSFSNLSSGYIAFLGITVVFLGLTFLMLLVYGFIYVVRTYQESKEKKKLAEKMSKENKGKVGKVSSDIVAVISLAIALEREKIQKEKEYILTWRKYHKTLSPWLLSARISSLSNFEKLRRKM